MWVLGLRGLGLGLGLELGGSNSAPVEFVVLSGWICGVVACCCRDVLGRCLEGSLLGWARVFGSRLLVQLGLPGLILCPRGHQQVESLEEVKVYDRTLSHN